MLGFFNRAMAINFLYAEPWLTTLEVTMTEQSIKDWAEKHITVLCDDPKLKEAFEKKIIDKLLNAKDEDKHDNQSSKSR